MTQYYIIYLKLTQTNRGTLGNTNCKSVILSLKSEIKMTVQRNILQDIQIHRSVVVSIIIYKLIIILYITMTMIQNNIHATHLSKITFILVEMGIILIPIKL